MIFFHNNAGNIGNYLQFVEMAYFELEFNIVIVGYRGYGKSEGTPGEDGIEMDADAIWEFV